MKEKNLKESTNEELKKKEKDLKGLIGVLSVATAFLLFFIIRDSLNGEEIEMSLMIIAICSICGGVSLYPQLKEIKEELASRRD